MPLQSRLNKLITPFDDESNDEDYSDNTPAGGSAGLDEVRAGPQPIDPNARLLALSPMMQQYSQMMQNYPKPEDYKASKTRRVLAALAGVMAAGGAAVHGSPNAGMQGFEISNAIASAPWNRAVSSFDTRAKYLEKGAEAENKQLGLERTIEAQEGRLKQSEENARIREENYQRQSADREAKYAQDKQIADAKAEQAINESKRKADEAQNKLELAQQIAAQKQGNAEAMIALHNAQLEALKANHELQNTMNQKKLDEAQRLHDMEKDKWDATIKVNEARIKALEDSITTKTEIPPKRTILGFELPEIMQPHPKVTVTTKENKPQGTITTATAGKKEETTEVPTGAKPGGKWITTSSGKKVYQEP